MKVVQLLVTEHILRAHCISRVETLCKSAINHRHLQTAKPCKQNWAGGQWIISWTCGALQQEVHYLLVGSHLVSCSWLTSLCWRVTCANVWPFWPCYVVHSTAGWVARCSGSGMYQFVNWPLNVQRLSASCSGVSCCIYLRNIRPSMPVPFCSTWSANVFGLMHWDAKSGAT